MNTQLCPTVCLLGEGEGEKQSPPDLSPSRCSLGRPGCGVSTWPNNGAGGGARLILLSTALQRPRCGSVLTGRVLQLSQMPGPPPSSAHPRKLALLAVSCSGREWPEFPRAMWEQSVCALPGQGTPPHPTSEALSFRPVRVGAWCLGWSAWGQPRAGLAAVKQRAEGHGGGF